VQRGGVFQGQRLSASRHWRPSLRVSEADLSAPTDTARPVIDDGPGGQWADQAAGGGKGRAIADSSHRSGLVWEQAFEEAL